MQLTTEQKQALERGEAVPITIDQTECVVVRKDRYESTRPEIDYDDSEWTTEEIEAIAAQTFERMDEQR